MGEIFDNLFTIAVIAYVAWGLIQRFREITKRGGEQPGAAPSDGLPTPEHLTRLEAQLTAEISAGEHLAGRLTSLEEQLHGAQGNTEPLADAIQTLRARESTRREALARARATISRGAAALAAFARGEGGRLGGVIEEARLDAQRVEIVGRWVRARSDRREGEALVDAEALVAELLRPLRRFAEAHEAALPPGAPICVPGHGAELLRRLLPGRPVIITPAHLAEDVVAWADVVTGVGRLLWRAVPGIEDEVYALTGGDPRDEVLESDGRTMSFSPEALMARWAPELFADVCAVIFIGPAALSALGARVARGDEPGPVAEIGTVAGSLHVNPRPPPHLRVVACVAALERLGFTEEARVFMRGWRATHGDVNTIAIALPRGPITLPADAITDPVERYVADLLAEPFDALDGVTLGAVPGLELTRGVWAQVARASAQLEQGEPADTRSPRLATAAAIEAVTRLDGVETKVSRALRRSIRGLTSEGRYSPSEAGQRRTAQVTGGGSDATNLEDIRHALVFREVFYMRRGPTPHSAGIRRRHG